jgi:hypothetical protein
MKTTLAPLALILSGLVAAPQSAPAGPPARPSVALVSKVILDVTRKVPEEDWAVARRGETLAAGDRVKTGAASLAIIKFKDNSLVRVRERSELGVTGQMNGRAFSKSVDVRQGGVGFHIEKQSPNEEFQFSSPTSVASIRGTGGQYVTGAEDTLVIVEGSVELKNSVSNRTTIVEAGFTGIARPDGSIETRRSTDAEQQAALAASRGSDADQRLEFELRDRQGGRRDLKLEYKEY